MNFSEFITPKSFWTPCGKAQVWNYHLVVVYLPKRLFQSFCVCVSILLSRSDNLKNSRHVGFSSHAFRLRCKLLLYFCGFCNYYSIYFFNAPLSIFSIVYTNIYTLSIFPVTYSLLCVISYLRMLFTPGCTSNNSNANVFEKYDIFDHHILAEIHSEGNCLLK